MIGTRPTYEAAEEAIMAFLRSNVVDPDKAIRAFTLQQHEDDGWSFSILNVDAISYLHHDLRIEWNGTSWPEAACGMCMGLTFIAWRDEDSAYRIDCKVCEGTGCREEFQTQEQP